MNSLAKTDRVEIVLVPTMKVSKTAETCVDPLNHLSIGKNTSERIA